MALDMLNNAPAYAASRRRREGACVAQFEIKEISVEDSYSSIRPYQLDELVDVTDELDEDELDEDELDEDATFSFDHVYEGEDAYNEFMKDVARLTAAACAGEPVTYTIQTGKCNLMIGELRQSQGKAFFSTTTFKWGGADD